MSANKRCADYPNGPTSRTKVKGRRDYAIALGRALHPFNLARYTGRPRRAQLYWESHAEAVKYWGERVVLNVDEPISERWQACSSSTGTGSQTRCRYVRAGTVGSPTQTSGPTTKL